jgi:hypothetical protein
MKPTQTHGIYLTKDQHLLHTVDWLVKEPDAWDWLCSWWAFEEFKCISEQNWLCKPSIHHYGAGRHVRKT